MSFLKICLILISAILLSSCAATYAPQDWLPRAEDIPSDTFGAWCSLTLKASTEVRDKEQNKLMGELIAVNDTSIYLLNDVLLNQIPKKVIVKSEIELDRKHYEYGLHTCLGIVSTISHGILLVATAPLWLVVGIPVSVGETNRDRYVGDPPDIIYWESVRKFSRFPQGIPTNLRTYSLKPKKTKLD